MFTLIIHRSLLAENTSFLLSPNTTQNQEMLNIYSKESLENNYQHIYFFFKEIEICRFCFKSPFYKYTYTHYQAKCNI